MKKYTHISDIKNVSELIKEAILLKKRPLQFSKLGEGKTLVLIFLNSSLRTRISTEKAAKNLGMNVISLNATSIWNLEFENGVVMNTDKAEHIKELAGVLSQYADIIGVRAFPKLKSREEDESEQIVSNLIKYASVPVISLESATEHPLQALADAITIAEKNAKKRPKVVLSWAPHPKALPHAVANSFVQMMQRMDVDFSITHPKGYELNPEIVKNTVVNNNQEKSLQDADFVYVKNWSSYTNYGKIIGENENWILTSEKLKNAKFMHCLPVRRNVVVEDAVLDGKNSLVLEQANNRTFAAQIILKKLL